MLHYNTVTSLLRETLDILMSEDLFSPFRLVGGTNLSLRLGHRMSDDIDLFTDAKCLEGKDWDNVKIEIISEVTALL